VVALDASALLAVLLREPGAALVTERFSESCMSTVNLAEVLAKMERDGRDVAALRARLAQSAVEWVPFGSDEAHQSALLASATRPLGLSLGDRACLALAKVRGIPALTADRAWTKLDVGVQIELIR